MKKLTKLFSLVSVAFLLVACSNSLSESLFKGSGKEVTTTGEDFKNTDIKNQLVLDIEITGENPEIEITCGDQTYTFDADDLVNYEYEKNEKGKIIYDDDGNPIIKSVSWNSQLSFSIEQLANYDEDVAKEMLDALKENGLKIKGTDVTITGFVIQGEKELVEEPSLPETYMGVEGTDLTGKYTTDWASKVSEDGTVTYGGNWSALQIGGKAKAGDVIMIQFSRKPAPKHVQFYWVDDPYEEETFSWGTGIASKNCHYSGDLADPSQLFWEEKTLGDGTKVKVPSELTDCAKWEDNVFIFTFPNDCAKYHIQDMAQKNDGTCKILEVKLFEFSKGSEADEPPAPPAPPAGETEVYLETAAAYDGKWDKNDPYNNQIKFELTKPIPAGTKVKVSFTAECAEDAADCTANLLGSNWSPAWEGSWDGTPADAINTLTANTPQNYSFECKTAEVATMISFCTNAWITGTPAASSKEPNLKITNLKVEEVKESGTGSGTLPFTVSSPVLTGINGTTVADKNIITYPGGYKPACFDLEANGVTADIIAAASKVKIYYNNASGKRRPVQYCGVVNKDDWWNSIRKIDMYVEFQEGEDFLEYAADQLVGCTALQIQNNNDSDGYTVTITKIVFE